MQTNSGSNRAAAGQPQPVQTEDVLVQGMDCPDELQVIEQRLSRMPGFVGLQPNYVMRVLRVSFDPGQTDLDSILKAVRGVGFSAYRRGEEPASAESRGRRVRLALTVVSGLCLAGAGLVHWLVASSSTWVFILLVSATLTGGWFVARSGLMAAWHGALDMNFLMTIAAAGAIVIGEAAEGASAMFLFSVALALESFSLDRARRAIRSLVEFAPPVAERICNDHTETVRAGEVRVGERLLVRPGAKIPLDGVVVQGRSAVNEAPVTGESMPVEKGVGDAVFAGTLNAEGALEIEARRLAADSTLARIIHLVEAAQSARAPSQRFVDAFARWYTPAVILLAVVLVVGRPLVVGAAVHESGWAMWQTSIYRGLVLLVISCPCALVISTPVTIVCGLFRAARMGVLIKGGVHLENVGRVRAVVFDKTGTLTRGQAEVERILPGQGMTAEETLALAAALEAHSEHPLALAITNEARRRGLALPPVREFAALPGAGAKGLVDGKQVLVGNRRLFQGHAAQGRRVPGDVEQCEAEGKSVVWVGTPGDVSGAIVLSDRPRGEAAAAVRLLHAQGVEHIAMLTGDNAGAARAIARQVGLDEFHAELLPQDKVDKVREWVERYRWVAMVGDGINDAPALAAATVGIAMGTAGSDTALETADVALVGDRLDRVPDLVSLGRRTRRIIGQNIAFSLVVKAVFLALAGAGWATMWMAVAADMGASLGVIFNGLRLGGIGAADSGVIGLTPEAGSPNKR